MPQYEYACQNCGTELVHDQKMSEDPLKTCPNCGKDELERLVSRTSFSLKGSGWYSDGYGAAAKTSSAPKPGGDSKSSSADSADKPKEPAKTEAPKTTGAKVKGGTD